MSRQKTIPSEVSEETNMTYPPKPAFTPSISFGNLLTLATIVVAVGIAWGQVTSSIESERSLRSQNQEQVIEAVSGISRDNEKMEQRVRNLEQQQARIDERFTMMITLLTDLKTEVSRLTQQESVK